MTGPNPTPLHERAAVLWMSGVVAAALGLGAIATSLTALTVAAIVVVAGVFFYLAVRATRRVWKGTYTALGALAVISALSVAVTASLGGADTDVSHSNTSGLAVSATESVNTPGQPVRADPSTGKLRVSQAWAMQRGCQGTTALAMPEGQGAIQSFHADGVRDIRQVLLEAGAGAWNEGLLELTLSSSNDGSVAVQSIDPHVDRTNLPPPIWVQSPITDCGGGRPPARTYAFALDIPKLVDVGLANAGRGEDRVDYSGIDVGVSDLGPDFTVSGTTQGSVDIRSIACAGNYEWSVDIHYTVAGDPTDYFTKVGPFKTYGRGEATTIYRTFNNPDGTLSVASSDARSGNACDMRSDLPLTKPSMHEPPLLSDFVGGATIPITWAHLGTAIQIDSKGTGSISFGNASSYGHASFRIAVLADGTASAEVTTPDDDAVGSPFANAGANFELSLEHGVGGPVLVGPDPLHPEQRAFYCQPNSWDQRCAE